jgi:hypothetical protein
MIIAARDEGVPNNYHDFNPYSLGRNLDVEAVWVLIAMLSFCLVANIKIRIRWDWIRNHLYQERREKKYVIG